MAQLNDDFEKLVQGIIGYCNWMLEPFNECGPANGLDEQFPHNNYQEHRLKNISLKFP